METTWQVDLHDRLDNFIASFGAINVSFYSELNSEGVARFEVATFDTNKQTNESTLSKKAGKLKSWLRVKIYLVERYPDQKTKKTKQWEGYIQNLKKTDYTIEVNCTDFFGWAEMKKTALETKYENTNISTIASNVLNSINGVKNTGWSLSSDFSSTTTYELKQGTSFSEIIAQIIEAGGEIEATYPNIKITSLAGRDLTGITGKSLFFNYKNPDGSNIQNPSRIDEDGGEKVNSVYYTYKSGEDTLNGVYRSIGADEEEIAIFRDFWEADAGSASQKAQKIIQFGEEGVSIPITPKNGYFRFEDFEVGDLVRLTIKSENEYKNFNQNFRILSKKVNKGDYFISELQLGEKKIIKYGNEEVRRQLRRLQLKT